MAYKTGLHLGTIDGNSCADVSSINELQSGDTLTIESIPWDGVRAGDNITVSVSVDGTGVTVATTSDLTAVTAGDGIDVANPTGPAPVVSVDVTDIIDTDAGLTENSNEIQVNLVTDGGLEFDGTDGIEIDVTDIIDTDAGLTENSNEIQCKVDTTTISFTGAGALRATPGWDGNVPHSDVTITAGNGLTGGGDITDNRIIAIGPGNLIDVQADQVDVDLSELTDMTADVVGGEDELVLLDDSQQRRKQIDEIKLGQFNNDQGWTAGGVTAISFVSIDDDLQTLDGAQDDYFFASAVGAGATLPATTVRESDTDAVEWSASTKLFTLKAAGWYEISARCSLMLSISSGQATVTLSLRDMTGVVSPGRGDPLITKAARLGSTDPHMMDIHYIGEFDEDDLVSLLITLSGSEKGAAFYSGSTFTCKRII